MRFTVFIVCLAGLRSPVAAQVIGITHPEQLSKHCLSLKYENDAFGNTDYYYTQGTQLQFTHPKLADNIAGRLLNPGNGDEAIAGIGIEHIGYTPTSILSDSVLYGDRPFAAAVMLQYFVVNVNAAKRRRISTQLSVGLIGPGAGGKEIQTLIHRNTNNDLPKGWQYQVNNDLVLNYYIRCDYNLLQLNQLFTLDITGGAALGTLSNKAFAGAIISTGWLNKELFSATASNFLLRLQYQPLVNLIGYDATMQGGLFNKKNSYTITANSISRLTFKQEIDLTLSYKHLQISANLAWLTKEFETGSNHSWGGIRLQYNF